MRRLVLAVVLAMAAGSVALASPTAAATITSKGSSLSKWESLTPGQQLVSPNGQYRATLQTNGRFVIRLGTRVIWYTHPTATDAKVFVHADGNVTLTSGSRLLWESATSGAGSQARLILRDTGALAVLRPAGLAWSSRYTNRCRGYTSGRKVFVDLSEQYLWLCDAGQQELIALVTTGAVDRGMGTPTGQWHVQTHQRDRYLYPASGGAYFVHYWLPYDYDYGFHDSSWQHFPYGSPLYRTQGSHGCVHLPAPTMAFTYTWAQNGTLVTIRA